MQERISRPQVYQLQPALVPSLQALGTAAAKGLEASLVHLVKMRASQINGCAFCQGLHAEEARHDGERQVRLDMLPAWREIAVFSAREKAALLWTELLTKLSDGPELDAAFAAMQHYFSAEEIVNLTVAIATINAWNRLSVAFRFTPLQQ